MRSRYFPVLVATLFLSLFGYLWYGVLFQDLQMQAHGYTTADYAGNSPLWYAGGALISLVIAVGLRYIVQVTAASGFGAAARAGLRAALGFGAPLVTYPFVFAPDHNVGLYAVGLGHILLTWPVAAGLLGAMGPAGGITARDARS